MGPFPPLSGLRPRDQDGYYVTSTGEHSGFEELEPHGNVRTFRRTRTQMQDDATDRAGTVRRFESGATRSSNAGKYEYARFLDPRVLKTYAAYMDRHRVMADGRLRAPDNWKRGIPLQDWMDSLWRHVQDLWEIHEYGEAIRPESGEPADRVETLCAILFNAMGYLHEIQHASVPALVPPCPGREQEQRADGASEEQQREAPECG